MVGHLLPGVELTIYDRHPDRARALADDAGNVAGIGRAGAATTARDATSSADVVVTAASFAPAAERQTLTTDWLGPETLVVAVDYATYVSASVATAAALFLTDQREQFLCGFAIALLDALKDLGDVAHATEYWARTEIKEA